jgi:uncharacterized membrane protein YdbT with pleckstrin-like domain
METNTKIDPPDIEIRPSAIFAFIKIAPLLICCLGLLCIAWRYFPSAIWLSIAVLAFAVYRYLFIRRTLYIITPKVLRFCRGIFFKRTDTVELFRVKDYIITQPFALQIFSLMDLTLKTTDPENPVVWLRGIPFSNLTDILRGRIIDARKDNRIYEIN